LKPNLSISICYLLLLLALKFCLLLFRTCPVMQSPAWVALHYPLAPSTTDVDRRCPPIAHTWRQEEPCNFASDLSLNSNSGSVRDLLCLPKILGQFLNVKPSRFIIVFRPVSTFFCCSSQNVPRKLLLCRDNLLPQLASRRGEPLKARSPNQSPVGLEAATPLLVASARPAEPTHRPPFINIQV